MKPIFAVIAMALPLSHWGAAQDRKVRDDGTTHLVDSLQGASLYKAYCAVCHGEGAKGSGPMTKSLKSAPPDLTRISARNGGVFPSVRVRRVISGEEALGAGHGTREMPVWGPLFWKMSGGHEDEVLQRVANLYEDSAPDCATRTLGDGSVRPAGRL